VRLGIPREAIHVTGIPVHPSFASPRPRREARLNLDLDPDLTTILVVAGGFGGPVETIVREARSSRCSQVVRSAENAWVKMRGCRQRWRTPARRRLHTQDG
jgi:UDP-N-acetylglucosamine:LPS N-acetylglucosamine transferase